MASPVLCRTGPQFRILYGRSYEIIQNLIQVLLLILRLIKDQFQIFPSYSLRSIFAIEFDNVNFESLASTVIQSSSESLFARIQECGWNKESYRPQFDQHLTTIEPRFTTIGDNWTTVNHQNLNFWKIKSIFLFIWIFWWLRFWSTCKEIWQFKLLYFVALYLTYPAPWKYLNLYFVV